MPDSDRPSAREAHPVPQDGHGGAGGREQPRLVVRRLQERQATAGRDEGSRILAGMADAVAVYRAVRAPSGEPFDFELTYLNPAATRSCGDVPERQLGRRLSHGPAGGLDHHVLPVFAELVRSGEPVRCPVPVCGPGLPVRMVEVSASRVDDGVVAVWRESAPVRAREAVPPAWPLLGQGGNELFMSTLAHELRNFLAPMQYSLALLSASSGRDPEFSEALPVLQRQIASASRLVDDMLDVARLRAGKLELRLETVTLAQVVQRSAELCLPVLDTRHQRLEVSGASDQVLLRADPVRLCQVLSNLLLNASKFSPEHASILVECESTPERVRLSVRDPGVGFDAAMAPRLFGLHEQATEGAHGGLGIGLYLVRHIMQRHGGDAQARSKGPGQGSEFSVWLPAPGGSAAGT